MSYAPQLPPVYRKPPTFPPNREIREGDLPTHRRFDLLELAGYVVAVICFGAALYVIAVGGIW